MSTRRILNLSASLGILAVALCLSLLLLDARALVKAQFGVVQSEAQKTRELTERQLIDTRREVLARADDALAEVTAMHQEAYGLMTLLTRTAETRLASVERDATAQIAAGIQVLDRRSGEALAQVAGLRADLQPVLTHAGEATAQLALASRETPDLVRDARFLAARSARTMGHVEQMADTVERVVKTEVPPAMAGVRLMTVDISGAVHEATKPKPWWKKAGSYAELAAKIGLWAAK